MSGCKDCGAKEEPVNSRAILSTLTHAEDCPTLRKAKTAEEIVRALAEKEPIEDDGEYHWCVLCKVDLPTKPEDHKPDCPYRMAHEWIEAQTPKVCVNCHGPIEPGQRLCEECSASSEFG